MSKLRLIFILFLMLGQEMLSLLLYGEGNAAQGQEVGVGLSTDERVMWLEAICAINASSLTDEDEVEVVKAIQPLLTRVNDQEGPRCFKSHSPLGLLQYMLTSKSKIIHVARNPKVIFTDVAKFIYVELMSLHVCCHNFQLSRRTLQCPCGTILARRILVMMAHLNIS